MSGRGMTRREIGLAVLLAALVFAWPLRDALFSSERVLFGVDSATVQKPWSQVIEAERETAAQAGDELRPRNPFLSDQAFGFYPYYRWVSASWRAGDPPLWNPLIFAGAPGLSNPQTGVLDPQVLVLALLEALGGEAAFHWGLTFTSFLRLLFAGLGAYFLARRLGLSAAGAALAGTTFGFSGYLVGWLGHSLGHVTPTLPWMLFFLEGVRRSGGGARAPVVGLALTTAAAILGGHPETSFYVGCAAGLWAVRILLEDRRAGATAFLGLVAGTLFSAPLLLPFLEYLPLSASQAIRETHVAGQVVDWFSVGLLLVAGALLVRARRTAERGTGAALVAAVGAGALVLGAYLVLRTRGLPASFGLQFFFDLFGAPVGSGGYRGPGAYLEEASTWLPAAAIVFALASLFAGRGVLVGRRWIVGIGLVAWLLALRAPGVLEVYQRVPVVGLGATVRAASVSSLMLGLLAGEALQTPRLFGRVAAGGTVVLLALGVLLPGAGEPLDPSVARAPESDEHVLFRRVPQPELGNETAALDGVISGALPVRAVRVEMARVDRHGEPTGERPIVVPAKLDPPSEATGGSRAFACPHIDTQHLAPGWWRFRVLLFADAEASRPLGERIASISERTARPAATTASAVALLVACLLLAASQRWSRQTAWLAVAAAAAQGVVFVRAVQPSVPAGEVFPPTRTEELVRREQGFGRYLSEPGVLPASCGMTRGLRALDGHDGMDVAEFNRFRVLALQPNTNALLGWNARSVDLDAPGFRLLGVTVLATSTPLEHPRWELFAGPASAPEPAEVYLYRNRAPFPRAFLVNRVADPATLTADPANWDPLELAAWDGAWRPERPFTKGDVEVVDWSNNAVRLEAKLDGDGLLVLAEQAFPGWRAWVDGEEVEVGTADGILRGVPLGAGEHEVVFRYRPRSLLLGSWAAGFGALLLIAWILRAGRRQSSKAMPS